jgi:Family of unknown function (DUF6496)
MAEKEVIQRAHRDERQGKAPSTQAGEFVREEMHHIREGKHGARSPQQAIAIGLSKARRAGVELPPPKRRKTSARIRARSKRDYRNRQKKGRARTPSERRSRAVLRALQREGHSAASRSNLSRQARRAAQRRSGRARHLAGMRAVHTKGSAGLRRAARKAARTRARNRKPA